MLSSRMRADLSVYLEAITRDADARKGAHQDRQRVARARLAYQSARAALAAHVDAHGATASEMIRGPQMELGLNRPTLVPVPGTTRHGRESAIRARRASA
jgi:hypothetical protein